mmetsp:Transcript_1663/g.2184  ORF Transcript_1663/g.2184 Transcript_1663/m.2184 type:complete len:154 (+) Transcript_1663:114-575(+)
MFKQITTLSLAGADAIASAALQEARRLKIKPVCIAIVDVQGGLILHKSEDGVGRLTSSIALAKAKTCIGLLASTRALRDKYAQAKPTQLTAFGQIAQGEFAPFPGGCLCIYQGSVIAAVGISGASADEDEHCVIHGIQSIDGLISEPPTSSLS